MRKPTEAQIKAAISAREKQDRPEPRVRHALRARMQARRRQGEKAITAYLRKAGFDFEAYQIIREQQRAGLHRLLREAETAAIKRSSSQRKNLAYGVQNWRKNIERFRDGTLVSPFVPAFEVVDTPFLIWPTNDLELDDSQVQPWNNTAKVHAQWRRESGSENLRFIFVWQSPIDKFVVVNVESNLAVNGACDVFAEGGFFAGSLNALWVQTTLNVWEWWNQPPTLLSPQATQTQKVLAIAESGGGFLSDLGGGSIDSANASGIFDVRRTLFSIPPNGVAVFEVTLEFFYDNTGGGMTQVNFASGAFEVKCPAVVIAVLS